MTLVLLWHLGNKLAITLLADPKHQRLQQRGVAQAAGAEGRASAGAREGVLSLLKQHAAFKLLECEVTTTFQHLPSELHTS